MFSRVVLRGGGRAADRALYFQRRHNLIHNERRNKCIRRAVKECASVSVQYRWHSSPWVQPKSQVNRDVTRNYIRK